MSDYDRLYYSIENYDLTEEVNKEYKTKKMNDNHQRFLKLIETFKKPITKINSDGIIIEFFSHVMIITFTITPDGEYRWETISYITDSTFRGTTNYSSLPPDIESALYQYFRK